MADFLAITTVIGYGLAMEKILISACLMGERVRYDGAAKPVINAHLAGWRDQGRLLVFCPEVAGGFAVPRPPAEIEPDADAAGVLRGDARVLDRDGRDVSCGFLEGAQAALSAAQSAGCRHAILMDGSPSCGSGFIYTGRFDGGRREGVGITTAVLESHGITVWSEARINDLAAHLHPR
ncbi:DUF523 domain-containing protein [Profundibacter sp.]